MKTASTELRNCLSLINYAEHVKRRILDEIQRRGISDDALCAALQLLPVGLEVVRDKAWSLDYAWQVCDVFGIPWEAVQEEEARRRGR